MLNFVLISYLDSYYNFPHKHFNLEVGRDKEVTSYLRISLFIIMLLCNKFELKVFFHMWIFNQFCNSCLL